MHFELLGNVPVLSIRCEPLESLENRIIKRAFDIVVQGCFFVRYSRSFIYFWNCDQGLSSPALSFSNRNAVVRMVVNSGVTSFVR